MAAAERLLRSLSEAQREELAGLMANALDDAGLAAEMARLADALRARRPDLDRAGMMGDAQMSGDEPLGLGDATTALAELADLAELESALGQDYPGASLDDIDEDAVRRALGRQAVDDVEALRRIERELERQGYLTRHGGQLELTPKAVRRLGDTALRRIFADMNFGSSSGDHDRRDAGQAGELTGTTRAWEFGDEQPIDVPATVRNALRAGGPDSRPRCPRGTSRWPRPSGAAPRSCHCSWTCPTRCSCAAPGRRPSRPRSPCTRCCAAGSRRTRSRWWASPTTRASCTRRELAGLGWDMVQGTNLHHALMLAGRHIDRHPEHEPVVLIVTDGEPTAHLQRDGRYWFDWPPSPETLELTLAEVDKMTRRHAALNIFMLADDARLSAFVDNVARRNGGRVLQAAPERLGEYVIRDFLRTRNVSRR